MKRILSIAFAAIVLAAGCTKNEAETKEIKVEAYAEIAGAFTKGLKISYEIVDFKGVKTSGVLNEKFDGQNCKLAFSASSKKVGESMTVSFHAERISSTLTGVMSPWSEKCGVKATIVETGHNDTYEDSETEESTMLELDGFPSFLSLITNGINTKFGDTWTAKVTIEEKGFTLETIDPKNLAAPGHPMRRDTIPY